MKLMERFKFFSTTFGINRKGDIINWGCCAGTKNNDFNAFDSIIYPSYIFDRFNISREKLTSFIKNLSLLNLNEYKGEITVLTGNNHYRSFCTKTPYHNLSLINPKLEVNILIGAYPKKTKDVKILDTIEELFDTDSLYENENYIEYINMYCGRVSSLMNIINYISSNRSKSGFNISFIKNKELVDAIKNIDAKSALQISLSVEDQDLYVFNPDVTFYNIPISNTSWSGSHNGLIRFILINLLRTFAAGYSINIINIFNVIRSKYPDQKSFNQIAYLLFSALAIDFALLNSETDTRTADKRNDYQILYLICDREDDDVRKCKEFKLYCKSKEGSSETGEYDSIFNWVIDYTDISEDYDESFNTITITLPELLEIHEHLRKNYTKKLINALKWN